MSILLGLLAVLGALAIVAATMSLRVVKEYERGVVYRFGRVRPTPLRAGLAFLLPVVDRLQKVNMQIITLPVPAQDGITRDNITVRVDAVVYFKVMDPLRAAVDVQDYFAAIGQVAQTSLRSIIGKSDLDDLLGDREKLNQGMELMIDSPAAGWGVHIDRVEIKDVSLPDTMKRSMSRQAEAERERRARSHHRRRRAAGLREARAGRRGHVGASCGAAAAAASDGGRGRRREELHPGAPVPGRAASLPGASHPVPANAGRDPAQP